MSLYETLDLTSDPPPDAAAIKRAYKRKAKMTHPDRGGKVEDFQKVSRAYLVLSDPVRRAKYDATGDIPEITPETAPLNLLVQFFVTVVQMHCAGQGPDPLTTDLIKLARDQFKTDIANAEKEIVKIKRSIKVWQKVEAKFGKAKKGAMPVTIKRAMLAQVAPLEAHLQTMQSQIELRNDAMKLLDGYTFDFDASPATPTNLSGSWIRFTS